MPTASADGWIESEGRIEKVSVLRVFGCVHIDAGPRRLPSARAEDVVEENDGPRRRQRADICTDMRTDLWGNASIPAMAFSMGHGSVKGSMDFGRSDCAT